jgi:hypothetical protein
MALESSTTILGLVATNPPSGDPLAQADDHLRLIKAVLQSEFTPYTHAAAGSIPLPGGLIIKWGTTTNSSGVAAVTTTFGAAFPTACYMVLLTPGANTALMGTVESTSTTGFTSSIWSDAGARAAGYGAFYLAIGK